MGMRLQRSKGHMHTAATLTRSRGRSALYVYYWSDAHMPRATTPHAVCRTRTQTRRCRRPPRLCCVCSRCRSTRPYCWTWVWPRTCPPRWCGCWRWSCWPWPQPWGATPICGRSLAGGRGFGRRSGSFGSAEDWAEDVRWLAAGLGWQGQGGGKVTVTIYYGTSEMMSQGLAVHVEKEWRGRVVNTSPN